MPKHIETGKTGEKEAVEFLLQNGYTILETNWRSGPLEADIIAEKNKTLVIIEVKTRSTNYFGEPEEFVNREKQSKLIKIANIYIEKNNIDFETRFDIVSVVINTSGTKVYHIEDAFYPIVKK